MTRVALQAVLFAIGVGSGCGAGTLEIGGSPSSEPAMPVKPDAPVIDAAADASVADLSSNTLDAGAPRLSPDAGGPVDAAGDRPPPTCASLTAALGGNWTRGPYTRFGEVPSINYAGHFLNPFPVTGSFGRFVTRDDEYLAIEFDTPLDVMRWSALQTIDWDPSQVGGAAVTSAVYITLSTCPGDFRIPGAADAPVNDPTFARGCRSVRQRQGFPLSPQSNLPYVVGTAPSTAEVCRLAPGRRYFLNFIRADAMDGRIGPPAEEARCSNPSLTACGVQLRVD